MMVEAEQAFAQGDYTRAAYGADSDELRGAALAMLGHFEAAVPLLERQTSPRARMCTAFALWSEGESKQALAALAEIRNDSPQAPLARRLERMIRQPKIRMLLQGRDDPNCPDYDLVGAFRAIRQADVKTLGYASSSDVVMDHWTTLSDVQARLPDGWTPDLFLSHLVEDNPPPIGFEAAPFPTFCQTQDYDRHYQHCRHWLPLFDSLIALGSVDHQDLHQLTGASVFVFPKLLGVSGSVPTWRPGPRPIDVFVSGTLFNLTRAKAEHLLAVSQLPDSYNVQMLEGYTTTDEYYRRMAQAKATFTFVHRWGLINGRALEAISQGTCATYQEGGELGLFLSEEDGAIPYRQDNAMQVLQRVVDQWQARYRKYAENGSRKVRDLFHFETGIRRYFHFLAFCTALGVPRGPRTASPAATQMRPPNRSPLRTMFHFDHSINKLAGLHDSFRAGLPDEPTYRTLDVKGESLLYSYLLNRTHPLQEVVASTGSPVVARPDFLTRAINKLRRDTAWARRMAGQEQVRALLRKFLPKPAPPPPPNPQNERCTRLLKESIEIYRDLTTRFPDRLAAAFNLGRLYYEQKNLEAAAQVFDDLLARPELRFQPEDLLFWREFHDEWIDYERVGQALIQYDLTQSQEHLDLIEHLMRSSALLYSASIRRSSGQSDQALNLLDRYESLESDSPALWLLAARLSPEPHQIQLCVRRAMDLNQTLIAALPKDELEQLGMNSDPGLADLRQLRQRLDFRRAG